MSSPFLFGFYLLEKEQLKKVPFFTQNIKLPLRLSAIINLRYRKTAAGRSNSYTRRSKYGYGTHESFARAFEQVWNCKPSMILPEKQEIPLNLHVTTVRLKDCNRCEEVFSGLHNAIREGKA